MNVSRSCYGIQRRTKHLFYWPSVRLKISIHCPFQRKKYHTSIVISLFEIPNGIFVIDIVTITIKCSQAIFNFNIVTITMLRNVFFLECSSNRKKQETIN